MGKARNYIKALRMGHKIYPEDIAGMVGLASVGNIYYVDAGSGSDNNNGKTRASALATWSAAHDAMTADQDDVAVIVGSNATGRTAETETLTWSKRRTHVLGNVPSRRINSRVGLGTAAALTGETTTAVFTLTGNNCSFTNISFADFNNNNILVEVQSSYNSFHNVHFQGMGHTDSANDANGRSLLLTASEENEFVNCTVGLDTVTRSAANSSLELTGSCARNKFIDCDFPLYGDDAAATWVKADTGNAYERFLNFENCRFTNASLGSSTVITNGMDLSTTGNGQIYIDGLSRWYGATNLANNVTNLIMALPVYDTSIAGIAVVHSNS